jgi:hypothetical protein
MTLTGHAIFFFGVASRAQSKSQRGRYDKQSFRRYRGWLILGSFMSARPNIYRF